MEHSQGLLQNTLKEQKQGRARWLCSVVGCSVLHLIGGPTCVLSLHLTPCPYTVCVILMPYAPSLHHVCRSWACHIGGGVDTLAVVVFGLYMWCLGCTHGVWALLAVVGSYMSWLSCIVRMGGLGWLS